MRVPVTIYLEAKPWSLRWRKAIRLLQVAWNVLRHGDAVFEAPGEIAGFRLPPAMRQAEPQGLRTGRVLH